MPLNDTDEPDTSIEPSSEMLSLSWLVEDARLPMTLSACSEYCCPLMFTLYASMRLNLPAIPELVLSPFGPKVSSTSLYFHTYWLGTSTCAFDWSLSTGYMVGLSDSASEAKSGMYFSVPSVYRWMSG